MPNKLIAPVANGTKAKANQSGEAPNFAAARMTKPKQIKPIEIKKATVFSMKVTPQYGATFR